MSGNLLAVMETSEAGELPLRCASIDLLLLLGLRGTAELFISIPGGRRESGCTEHMPSTLLRGERMLLCLRGDQAEQSKAPELSPLQNCLHFLCEEASFPEGEKKILITVPSLEC
ncbi:hypothetical protein DV515_00003049 [Chloebia gouldiae]|uniref:Uncharacterized protein n=1 Tax=Chloebia gouldiae TaxID=44316 RepID=A0A3L8SUX9_CHLGU|nr:hypothetical protein DV515_00003049 [Chloebia gouldiae]